MMFSSRVSVLALLAIAMMARFDQGAALKCHVCISTRDSNCLDAPEKIATFSCNGTNIPIPAAIPAVAAQAAMTAAPTQVKDEAQKYLEVLHVFSRYTNSSMASTRDTSNMVCIKAVYDKNGIKVVGRGCVQKGMCSASSAINEYVCHECDDKDGCNGSSQITLGIMSILIPVGLVTIISR